MTQEKILQTIRQICEGNMRYADAMDRIKVERGRELGVDDSPFNQQKKLLQISFVIYKISNTNYVSMAQWREHHYDGIR